MDEEVVRILAEISREDALPDDAAGLARRFAGQAWWLNEIDPYYWFEFGVAGEMVTVTAHPRYPGADRDRPITITATLQFDDSVGHQETRAAIEDFTRFGTPVITRSAVSPKWSWMPRPAWAANSGEARSPWTAPSRPEPDRRSRSCSRSPFSHPYAR